MGYFARDCDHSPLHKQPAVFPQEWCKVPQAWFAPEMNATRPPPSNTPAASDSTSAGNDFEKNGSDMHAYHDPFNLRRGIVTPEQLALLRKRKEGKKVAVYQRKQNKASLHPALSFTATKSAL
jgi:hypothetical protein